MTRIERNQYPMRFDKEMSAIVKGVALIFMMFLHSFGRAQYDVELDYTYAPLSKVFGVFKICIGIFAFMVGFGYSFSKTRDWKYALQHIKKLLIPFWVILLIFTFPFCWDDVVSCGWKTVLYNLFGIDSHYNYYSWFIYFYIYAMFAMPFISRVIDRRPILNTLLVVLGSLLLTGAIHELFDIHNNQLAMALFNSLMMTHVMVWGYLFGHEHYFERLNLNGLSRWLCLILALAVIFVAFKFRSYRTGWNGFQFDFFFAPMVIGSLVVIFNRFELKPLRVALARIGDVSMYMWFFHALFFTKAVRWFYQPAITIFNNINLVIIWEILLTFVASLLIKYAIDRVSTVVKSHN